ncbi:response regulator [Massilia sp. W12]|uniref:response regulator n=1 Tax=Massilia sp. W12 TaxID=3126507 RepID=UPI0030CD6BA1
MTTTPSNGSAALRSTDWKDLHYLLVDHTKGMRQLLRESLRSLGARYIDQASSGGEAIGLLTQTHYDVVLCEYHLGQGKNGQQVLEEAKFRDLLLPTTAWLMVTSEKNLEAVMGTAELHPDAYLLKPITQQTLLNRLSRIWQRKQILNVLNPAWLQRDFARAAKLCDMQIAQHRFHALYLLRMKASLLLKCGRSQEAREVYERVLATRQFSWAMTGVASIRMQNGEAEIARSMLTEVINGNRYFMEAYDQLALAHQQLGQFEEAALVLEKAATMSPNSVLRQRSLGEVSLKLGHTQIAERAFRKCLALGEHSVLKSADAYLGLARICGMKNDTDEALSLLHQVQREFTSEQIRLRSKITEGLVLHESGEWERARKSGTELSAMLQAGNQRPPPAVALDMARLLFATGIEDAPIALLRELARNNHDNPQLLGEIRQVFARARMAEEGDAIVNNSSAEAADMMNRGVLLWKTGKLMEAVEWMRDTARALPDNQRVLFNYAQIVLSCMERHGFDAGMADEARHALLQVDSLMPGQARFHMLMDNLNALLRSERQRAAN